MSDTGSSAGLAGAVGSAVADGSGAGRFFTTPDRVSRRLLELSSRRRMGRSLRFRSGAGGSSGATADAAGTGAGAALGRAGVLDVDTDFEAATFAGRLELCVIMAVADATYLLASDS